MFCAKLRIPSLGLGLSCSFPKEEPINDRTDAEEASSTEEAPDSLINRSKKRKFMQLYSQLPSNIKDFGEQTKTTQTNTTDM